MLPKIKIIDNNKRISGLSTTNKNAYAFSVLGFGVRGHFTKDCHQLSLITWA